MKLVSIICFFLLLSTSTIALASLDVTALSELEQVLNPKLNKDGEPMESENQVRLAPVDMPERFANLQSNAVYSFKERYDFNAGSYSGYNWWRNELARIAGYPSKIVITKGKTEERFDASAWDSKSGPFWELIYFSDAEGVIGPIASKKLYADFLAFKHKAMEHPDQFFKEAYLEWEHALSVSAKNGALVFH